MPKKSIPVYHRQEQREEKEVSAKDLSRKELAKYIFEDFFRGFYIVGAIFLNGLILTEIYYARPLLQKFALFGSPLADYAYYTYYFIAVIILLEIPVTALEIQGFAKIWMK